MLKFIIIGSLTFSAQFHLVPAQELPELLEQLSSPQCNRADVQIQWPPTAQVHAAPAPSSHSPAPRLILHFL